MILEERAIDAGLVGIERLGIPHVDANLVRYEEDVGRATGSAEIRGRLAFLTSGRISQLADER